MGDPHLIITIITIYIIKISVMSVSKKETSCNASMYSPLQMSWCQTSAGVYQNLPPQWSCSRSIEQVGPISSWSEKYIITSENIEISSYKSNKHSCSFQMAFLLIPGSYFFHVHSGLMFWIVVHWRLQEFKISWKFDLLWNHFISWGI